MQPSKREMVMAFGLGWSIEQVVADIVGGHWSISSAFYLAVTAMGVSYFSSKYITK